MKTNVILSAIVCLGFIFTSCEKEDLRVVPSEKVTTTSFSASNISQLDVSDIFKVYVSFSETERSVEVEANENIHGLIEIGQSGNRLIVGLKRNASISGTPVLNVYIKTSTLSEVNAEGATNIHFENFLKAPQLELEITGAAKVSGNVEVGNLIADLLGASVLEISGNSNSFDIDAEGACKMTGFGFATNTLKTDLNGGSNISLVVNQKLDVKARGASKVYFKGTGVIEKKVLSDASEIIKMD